MLSGEETYMKMEISGGNKYFVTLSEETLAVTCQNSRVYILNLEVLLLGICPTEMPTPAERLYYVNVCQQ